MASLWARLPQSPTEAATGSRRHPHARKLETTATTTFGRPGKPNPGSSTGFDPPNNYLSFFSGSAWQFDPATKEYYLHYFAVKQPDLDWDNPKLQADLIDLMKFWLDKGVDGFRMDVIPFISKREGLPGGLPGGLPVMPAVLLRHGSAPARVGLAVL
jgi:glycosidase